MKNPQEDDAVERMLNQLEGLLKRQHDSARASRSSLTPVEDEVEAVSPSHHLPQITGDVGPDGADHASPADGPSAGASAGEAGSHDGALPAPPNGGQPEGGVTRLIEAEPYDPDATAPEMDAFDPDATKPEMAAVGVNQPADATSMAPAASVKTAGEEDPRRAEGKAPRVGASAPETAARPVEKEQDKSVAKPADKKEPEATAKPADKEQAGATAKPADKEQAGATAKPADKEQSEPGSNLADKERREARSKPDGKEKSEAHSKPAAKHETPALPPERRRQEAAGGGGTDDGEATGGRQDASPSKLAAVPISAGEAPAETTETAHMSRRLTTRLGQLLLDVDLLSEAQLRNALEQQSETGEKLGKVLVNGDFINETDLLAVLAKQHGVPTVDLDNIEFDPAAAQMIPADMARRYELIPMAIKKDAVDVAMVDPTDFVAMAHVRFATGLRPNVFITTSTAAERAMARLYSGEEPESAAEQPRDPRTEIKKMILDRDAMLIAADKDPRKFYELAATIDAFVDEIMRKACG